MADEVVQHYIYDISGGETSSIKDGDTTNPILYEPGDGTGPKEATVTAGDYVNWVDYYQYDDPVVPSFVDRPLYVYTLNSEWKYVGGLYNRVGCNFVHNCAGDSELTLANGDDFEGSTCDEVIIKPKDGNTIYRSHIKNTDFYEYAVYEREEDEYYEASEIFTTTSATIKVTPGDGISAIIPNNIYSDLDYGIYQYPGIWVRGSEYPKLDIPIPEPKYKGHVQLKWTDPPDITDWKPTPATWEGTVIVRKENSAPLHRWDGDKVVRTTTRDKYKSKPYKDEDIETNKVYYYAFMPYYTKIDDPQHPIRYYTFTKCIRVETGTISYIPEIIKIDMNEDVATITYAITLPATGPYDTAKLYGKKDDNPACDNTDDIVEDISQVDDQVVVPDIDGDYFFCIQVVNGTDTFTSDVVSCSGEGENPDPDYETLYSQINVWNIIHTPNWSIIVPDVWVAPTQNDYTGRYFVWDTNDRLNHSYYRANAEPGQWSICSTNQDVYSLSNVITINIDKDNNDKYVVILPTLTWSNDVFKNSYQYPGSKYYGWRMDYNGSTIRAVGWYASSTPSVSSPNPFNTLYDALYWTVAKFKHFTLYVDGTLWVRAN